MTVEISNGGAEPLAAYPNGHVKPENPNSAAASKKSKESDRRRRRRKQKKNNKASAAANGEDTDAAAEDANNTAADNADENSYSQKVFLFLDYVKGILTCSLVSKYMLSVACSVK